MKPFGVFRVKIFCRRENTPSRTANGTRCPLASLISKSGDILYSFQTPIPDQPVRLGVPNFDGKAKARVNNDHHGP